MSHATPSASVSCRLPKSMGDQHLSYLERWMILTDTTDELAEDDDVGAARDVFFERTVLEQALGDEVRRTDIGVKPQLFSESQDPLLRSNRSYTPLGPTHRA